MKLKWFIILLGFFSIGETFAQSDQVILNNDSILNYLLEIKTISSTRTWELDKSELELIETIVIDCVKTYNAQTFESFKARKESRYAKIYQIMNLEEYKIQIVPYLNINGEKEIWINGFCDGFETDWKTELIQVLDGGNCYFSIKLNLTTGKCLEVGTNGHA